jgi:hypothetical protein
VNLLAKASSTLGDAPRITTAVYLLPRNCEKVFFKRSDNKRTSSSIFTTCTSIHSCIWCLATATWDVRWRREFRRFGQHSNNSNQHWKTCQAI